MKRLTGVAVVVVITLAASACGSGHRVTFSAFSKVGDLSVPAPPGFDHRYWAVGGVRGGVVFSDAPIGLGSASAPLTAGYLPENPNRVAFDVYRLGEAPPPDARHIRLPLTFDQLSPATRHPNGVLRGGAFMVGQKVYGAQVWLGRSAPAADRSAVLSAVHEIKPPNRQGA